jgi:hypothetical protein
MRRAAVVSNQPTELVNLVALLSKAGKAVLAALVVTL